MPVITTGPGQLYIGNAYVGSTTSSTATWLEWNTTYATGGPVCATSTWAEWNATYTVTYAQETARQLTEETAEQRAERERIAAEWQAARVAARERAEQLLRSLLTPEQVRSYEMRRFFEVTGSAGGRWRIRRGSQAGNVDLLGADGAVEATLCCHPPDGLPEADAHLAQMLQLVTDEEGFRRTGNWTRRRVVPAAA